VSILTQCAVVAWGTERVPGVEERDGGWITTPSGTSFLSKAPTHRGRQEIV